MIIYGDFNSNAIWNEWDRWWNHSDVVRGLKEIDIESVYYSKECIKHRDEKLKTFYLYKHENKAYHVDYVFASRKFLNT